MSEPGSAGTGAPATRTPQGVLVASTLCWLWGVVVLLSSVALLIPAVAMHGVGSVEVLFPAAMFLVSCAYLFAGYALRRQRRAGGWSGGSAAVLMVGLLVRSGLPGVTIIAFLVNVAIVALVLLNWRHLGRAPGSGVAV